MSLDRVTFQRGNTSDSPMLLIASDIQRLLGIKQGRQTRRLVDRKLMEDKSDKILTKEEKVGEEKLHFKVVTNIKKPDEAEEKTK
ncbi:Hypothetical predicted protein, partial [Olea europaea subsp. europaea]